MVKRQEIDKQLLQLDAFSQVVNNDDFIVKSILSLLNKNDFDYGHKKWLCERVIESL